MFNVTLLLVNAHWRTFLCIQLYDMQATYNVYKNMDGSVV